MTFNRIWLGLHGHSGSEYGKSVVMFRHNLKDAFVHMDASIWFQLLLETQIRTVSDVVARLLKQSKG